MKHNENLVTPEPATDEPGSSFLLPPAETRRFATAAEEAAYRAGLAERVRGAGAGPPNFAFDPVALRYRADGLTPAKQREYVEALADTGVARVAADRIGVSEQAVNRLRRRADARSFDLACEAARRFGARRLHSIAWERAIEGTIKRHHYHGELKSEERVYDNRLLIYLLGKTGHLLDEPREARLMAANWQPNAEALEQGLRPPDFVPHQEREDLCHSIDVWQDPDGWWTSFPPPAGFDGEEEGRPGSFRYRRRLSDEEQAVVDADEAVVQPARIAEQAARRDLHFGFEGGSREEEEPNGEDEGENGENGENEGADGAAREGEIFSPMGPEPYETSGAGVIAEPRGEDDKEAP